MPEINRLKKPPVLKDWAYQYIKDRIFRSQYPPGSLLKIEVLSRELGISRTPIREALLRLEQEGLVVTRRRVGSYVAEFSTQEFVELLEIRALLEGFGVNLLAGLLTEAELAELENMISACETEVNEGNPAAFASHDIAFHNYLIQRAPNPWLAKLIRPIESLRVRQRSIAPENLDHVVASLAEHRAIFEALRAGNGTLAAACVQAHLRAIQDRLLPQNPD
ncbi:MAG: GntR family transcriptional regulator [Anaerolineales bacterium]|nr:GntR family transcriptional regulator [Anaerolineales bacterium]